MLFYKDMINQNFYQQHNTQGHAQGHQFIARIGCALAAHTANAQRQSNKCCNKGGYHKGLEYNHAYI